MADVTARDIGKELKNVVNYAITGIIMFGAVTLVVILLNYVAYQANTTSNVPILTYFQPIQSIWNTIGTIYLGAIMLLVVSPIIVWLVQKFRPG